MRTLKHQLPVSRILKHLHCFFFVLGSFFCGHVNWRHLFYILVTFFCGASLIVSQWFVGIRDAGRTVGQNCSKYSSNLTSMSHITTTTTYLQRLLSPGMMVLSCNWEMGDDGWCSEVSKQQYFFFLHAHGAWPKQSSNHLHEQPACYLCCGAKQSILDLFASLAWELLRTLAWSWTSYPTLNIWSSSGRI